jgi:hypothetical protein
MGIAISEEVASSRWTTCSLVVLVFVAVEVVEVVVAVVVVVVIVVVLVGCGGRTVVDPVVAVAVG